MAKQEFVEKYKAARQLFNQALVGLSEKEASQPTGGDSEWPTIKDLIGHVAAWEREVLIADEMIKRGEESYLHSLNIPEFNQTQSAHRRSWTLEQLTTELDLNYEALLMAWDEYEGEDGPFGPATWQPGQPDSLDWLIGHQHEHGSEIARRRGLSLAFDS